jgi:hypothetical protein
MKLTFHPTEVLGPDRRMHPNGYWVAQTDKGGYDGAGPDPLTAISRLALTLEAELDEATEDA